MKISLGQINPLVGDLEYNFKKILDFIQAAKNANANLVIFPELSLLGYPPKDLIYKTALYKKQLEILEELKLYSDENFAIVVGGIHCNESYGPSFYNSIFCIADGEIQSIASKMLLPNYDVFDETRYFKAAEDTKVWTWQGIKFGLSICEDIWIEAYPSLYSRNPFNELLAEEAQIIINCSASPYVQEKSHFQAKLIGNLVQQHQVPILYVNQVGANDQLIFDGSSMVFSKTGSKLCLGKAFSEDLISFDTADLESSASCDFEHKEVAEETLEALCLGLKDYVAKCGFDKVVLGLSGGIDSALVAYIGAKALGPEKVYAYMMPSQFTSRESYQDAEKLAKNLGINYQIIPIDLMHEKMRELVPELTSLADENLQPRLRANILMAFSNSLGAILISTGNKSEIAVGYSTLYGDSCGALAVIGDVLKTQVYELCHFINKKEEVIPANILNKAPSAELKHDQKDSDTLPDYEVLDQIIKLYVQDLKSLQEIIDAGFDAAIVKKSLNMIDKAEFKRQQSPPILKIAGKAFGIGRRMPIVQGFIHK